GGVQVRKQAFLGRIVAEVQRSLIAHVGVDWPLERAGSLRNAIGKWVDQERSAQIGRRIAEMAGSPKGDLLCIRAPVGFFIVRNRACVTLIVARSVEC